MKRCGRVWLLIAVGLCGTAGVASADRATAKKLTDRAVKDHYKRRDWEGALEGYREALKADPTYARAHYYIASAAALLDDLPTVRKELAWTAAAAATDKEARKLLKLALKDPDLDSAAIDPEVRRLIGMPALDSLTAEQRLSERRGKWSAIISANCCGGFVTLTFGATGKVTATGKHSEYLDDGVVAGAGTYVVDKDGGVRITWTRSPATGALTKAEVMLPCKQRAPGTCFIIGTVDNEATGEADPVELLRGERRDD